MFTVPAAGPLLSAVGGDVDVRVYIDTGLTGASLAIWDSSDWDESVWGSSDASWNDITAYVLNVSIDGGARQWGESFEATTANILVDNRTGIFTPESGVAAPWALPFRPGRRMQVAAIVDGVKEPLFTGTIDATFDGFSPDDVQTRIPCTDFSALWQQHDPSALETPTGVQTTDERVTAALDRFDWDPTERDIQTGLHTMQTSHLAQSTMEEMRYAAMSEQGAVFASRDGKAVFKARDWLTTDTRSTEIQGYIGYETVSGASTPVAHLVGTPDVAWEQATIANQVQFARVGSTVYSVEDTGSIALYDRHTHRVLNFQNNLDSEVELMADTWLGVHKLPRQKIKSVSVIPVKDPDDLGLNRMFWETEYGDLIAVKIETPYGWHVSRLTKVFGISHEISAEDWIMTLYTDDVFSRVNGSSAHMDISARGGGQRLDGEGGSEAIIYMYASGAGDTLRQGGSEAAMAVSVAPGEGVAIFEGGSEASAEVAATGGGEVIIFQDDFAGMSIDTGKWVATDNATQNEYLILGDGSTTSNANGYAESDSIDLDGDWTLSLEVPQIATQTPAPTGSEHSDTELIIFSDDFFDGIEFHVQQSSSGTVIVGFVTDTGGGRQIFSITYNASTHLWWRLVKSGSTLTWYTSSDGSSWTSRGSDTVSFDDLSAAFITLEGSHLVSAGTSTNPAHFDNLTVV